MTARPSLAARANGCCDWRVRGGTRGRGSARLTDVDRGVEHPNGKQLVAASAMKPSISDDGNGHGCELW